MVPFSLRGGESHGGKTKSLHTLAQQGLSFVLQDAEAIVLDHVYVNEVYRVLGRFTFWAAR